MTGTVPPLRILGALIGIALAGALLIPWETRLQKEASAAGFRGVVLDLGLREQVGQSGFLAALSGFRSPLAAYLWIEAYDAWEKTEWGRMAGLFDTVTTLQPRNLTYWDMASWHMAWNASHSALNDATQKSELLRERARRQYIELGKEILERGIRNNPGSYLLHQRLGFLLRDKMEDHAGAADAFAKAASLPGCPAYVARFAAYEEAKVPGRERQAYDHLRALYEEGEKMRLPTLLSLLRDLEVKLGIPEDRRIPAPAPKPAAPSAPHPSN